MPGLSLTPDQLIARVLILLIALPIHELAHAWTANYFGDDTPRLNGRLSLNPLAHLDVLGSILIMAVGFGWAKPVPVNPYALQRRSPLAYMLVSAAGPFSNFLLAILLAIPLRMGWIHPTFSTGNLPSLFSIVLNLMAINIILMLFNLIPIAPLDGSKIAVSVLPESWGRVVEQISAYGPIILLALVFLGPQIGIDPIGWVMTPVMNNLIRLLIGA